MSNPYFRITRQRKAYRDGKLSEYQIQRLVDVGFVFQRCKTMNKTRRFTQAQEQQWDGMYDVKFHFVTIAANWHV